VLALDRLPAVAFTTGLSAAESNLRSAERCLAAGDATGFALALSAAGFGLAAASAARCGAVIPLMKKSVPVLAELSRAGSEPPVSVADLAAVVGAGSPAERVAAARASLARLRQPVPEQTSAEPVRDRVGGGAGGGAP
jgi:hypothetical protein